MSVVTFDAEMEMLVDYVKRTTHELAQETIDLRRQLHQQPETAFQEIATSALVAEQLNQLNLTVRSGIGKTGVVAVLDSGRKGRTVLARADMDALPIQTELDVPYRSTKVGVMHACGHDGHTAVLLSTAKTLVQHAGTFEGRVVFVFQPAEETLQGAKAMLQDGALDDHDVDASIGLHLINDFPLGTVHLRSGPAMAATDTFRIVVKGRGGHAAKPHQNVDPIVIAAQLVCTLQTLISRENDPVTPAVISITQVQGGSNYNVIPGHVELKGTLRTFSTGLQRELKERVGTLSRNLAEGMRGAADVEWLAGSPAVVNDAELTKRMRRVAEESVGREHVFEPTLRMSGEDMAYWLQSAPGCFFFVGTRNEEEAIDKPHHHPQFDLDEAALPLAVELLTKGILDFLRLEPTDESSPSNEGAGGGLTLAT